MEGYILNMVIYKNPTSTLHTMVRDRMHSSFDKAEMSAPSTLTQHGSGSSGCTWLAENRLCTGPQLVSW